MTRLTIISLTLLTTLLSCDFSGQVKDSVDKKVSYARIEMSNDLNNTKSGFEDTYRQVSVQSNDIIFLTKIANFYSSLTMTSKYIDSLRAEMDKLDNMDTKNVELIKEKFLFEGVADSVFNKMRQSYSLAIDIAVAETTKLRLKKVLETYNEEMKKQLFGLSSPLGVNMILYGIQSELIKDGTSSLSGHSKN